MNRLLPWIALAVMVLATLVACDKRETDSIALVNRGVRALDRGDDDTALAYFTRAARLMPENADAHYHLGLVYLHFGDEPETALRHLETAERFAPDDVDVLYQIGRLQVLSANHDRGVAYLQRVVSLDAHNVPARHMMGVAHEQQGEVSLADAMWREAVTLQPTYARSFVALGALYEGFGAEAAARAVYEEGLEHSPTHNDLANRLGVLAMRSDQLEEAVAHFRDVLARDGGRTDTLFNLAFAYAQTGAQAKAIRYLTAFIRSSPDASPDVVRVAEALRNALESELPE